MSQMRSLPSALAHDTLEELVGALQLEEVPGPDGGPFLALMSQAPVHEGQCGKVRKFEGDALFRVITCSIVAPVIQLDSHMIFAFAPSDSAIPHFTLDSVESGDHLAFHLDILPRVDLGANLSYIDAVYSPLTEAYEKAEEIEGLSKAHISPRQRAIMSPWMLVNRATEEAFPLIRPFVATYLNHWLGLVQSGIDDALIHGATASDLVERDRRNKAIIFDPDVDKVWNQITGLVGERAVVDIRAQLMETSQ